MKRQLRRRFIKISLQTSDHRHCTFAYNGIKSSQPVWGVRGEMTERWETGDFWPAEAVADWTLRDVLLLARRYLWWLILVPFFGALGGWIGSMLQTPVWEARTQVLVTRSSTTGTDAELLQYVNLRDLLYTYKDLLSEPWVREELVRRLGGEAISSKQVRVTIPRQGLLLQIATRDADPLRAQKMADTLVQILIEQHQALQEERYRTEEERLTRQIDEIRLRMESLQQALASAPEGLDPVQQEQLQKELDLYRQLYLNLLDKRETIRLHRLYNVPNVIQVRPAQLVPDPVAPKTMLNIALGGVVGLFLVAGVIFLRESLNQTVRSEEDLRRLHVPLLATIVETEPFSEGEGPQVWLNPQSPYAEAFRVLRTNLEFLIASRDLRLFLVTSPGPGERKTSLAANLAAIFAQAEKRVLLVDADFRRPRVHRVFGLSNRVGFSTLFRHADLSLQQVFYRWKDSSLYVMPSGRLPPHPAEVLRSPRTAELLQQMRSAFDLVILDVPPLVVADAMILAAHVDGVLMSVVLGQTHRVALRKVLEPFRQAENTLAPLLGLVAFLPAGERAAHDGYYTYYTYYTYYKQADTQTGD